MKFSPYLLIIILASLATSAFAEDSIAANELKELTVTMKRSRIEGDKFIFLPTKKEKQLSNSPATLIEAMHLPVLKVKDGQILTLSGEPVSIFINGERAENVDIATFWPKNAKRIEYIPTATDPKYEGASSVINFVMQEYEAGGVTRLNGFQRMPNIGYYTAASKLVYKKMTYGALFHADYSRDHRSSRKGSTTYKTIYYDNAFFDEIVRNEDENFYERDQRFDLSLNARYSTNKFRATHAVSFGWSRNPGSGAHSTGAWSANLFDSDFTSAFNTSKYLTQQVSGNYYAQLSRKWHIAGKWIYTHSGNNSTSETQFGHADIVYNHAKENVNSLNFYIFPSLILSEKWLFQYKLESTFDWYTTDYSGTANTQQTQHRKDISSFVRIGWTPSENIKMTLTPGIAAALWKIGEIRRTSVQPTANLSLNWSPTSKVSFNGSLGFFMRPPTAGESNPILIKTSELLWTRGNAWLKSLTSWDTYLMSSYLASNRLNFALGIGYTKTRNDLTATYDSAPIDMGGLIKYIENAKPIDRIRISFDINTSFFDDKLSINLAPHWHYAHSHDINFNHFNISADADYTIGNCKMQLSYEGPYKDIAEDGRERTWQQDCWNFSFTYGIGNVYMNFHVDNIFHNKAKNTSAYTSPNFSTEYTGFRTGRTFFVNLTYTFDYGKKTDRRIDISGPESTRTSILTSKK